MQKRLFDLVLTSSVLLLGGWFILLLALVAAWDTRSNGFFLQTRIGQHGRPFQILKLRSMHRKTGQISAIGRWLRKYKLDELPQFFNVLLNQMSIVGPRPDISGYYDRLEGDDRRVLALKPGLTSRASIKYADEETLLAQQPDPLDYNDRVLFPDKVRLNLAYLDQQSLKEDLTILFLTIKKIL